MKEPTDEQKRKIEMEALQVLARFSEIVGSDKCSVEAVLVATTAQAALAVSYFAAERGRDDDLVMYFAEVGARLGSLVFLETTQLARHDKEAN